MTDLSHLLVDGYIRYIEKHINNQIIPDVIRILCIQYYVDVAKKLWFFSCDSNRHPKMIYISPDIDIEDTNTIYIHPETAKYNIKMFDTNFDFLSRTACVDFLDGGVCCISNIIFPKNKIIAKIQNKVGRNMNLMTMFQCNQHCYAKIFTQHHDSKEFVGSL